MKNNLSITITESNFSKLFEHIFPGDDDEHGAILTIGISKSNNHTRLLVREVLLAKDNIDYVPGERGYRALTAEFVARTSDHCIDNNLGYLAVHNHIGVNDVSFSSDDIASHKRGYPALLQMIGEPIGALVFAKNAVAGEIWTDDGVKKLDYLKIIGSRIKTLYPSPRNPENYQSELKYDRHARLFGEIGQSILNNTKVGIIGVGGGGSLINEWLSKLGIGEIIAIDFDKLELSNHPRVIGTSKWDCPKFLVNSKYPFLQKLGKKLSKYKVHIAQRVAKKANSNIKYSAIVGDISDKKTALRLKDVDFIFLATDNITSRNVFNSLIHQYLIPGAQIGAKVRTDKKSKEIIEIFSVGRIIIPQELGGCLYCNGWIPPSRLQDECINGIEKKQQNYIENEAIQEPSVITLNVLSAAHVVNDFMMMFTGLYPENKILNHIISDVLYREHNILDFISESDCLHCSNYQKSNLAKGDRGSLPCKNKP